MITCILPVYNNSETVESTIKTLLSIKEIDEVIVVDDKSTDSSTEIIKKFGSKIKFIQNNTNLGKGGAFITGLKVAKGNLILTCDADHRSLKKEHLENIINEYHKGKYDMVVGARENDKGWGALMAKITGERIFELETITKYLDLIQRSRYGMEQIINYVHRGKKVGVIVSKDIGHILKFKRKNLAEWSSGYIFQIGNILKTYWQLRRYH